MPSGNYYRTQAQLFARLAAATSNPRTAERYRIMALQQLAMAGQVDARSGEAPLAPKAGSSMDRDGAGGRRPGGRRSA